MSIYIKGMKMPKSCWECPCDYGAFIECVCGLTEQSTEKLCKNRRDDCPLVEVPPHGRLIDADALINHLEFTMKHCTIEGHTAQRYREIIVELSIAPTIIPAEEEQ